MRIYKHQLHRNDKLYLVIKDTDGKIIISEHKIFDVSGRGIYIDNELYRYNNDYENLFYNIEHAKERAIELIKNEIKEFQFQLADLEKEDE